VKGYQFLSPRKNETTLKDAIYNIGPISVSILATDNFQNYKHGVFYDPKCENTEKTDHNVSRWAKTLLGILCKLFLFRQVLAIGYGTENGQDYWLIKNQYDTWWGEQGYAKMARNKNNNCNIASWPIYPLI
jgi:cathepsin L